MTTHWAGWSVCRLCRLGQYSGACTDNQSSRLLQQCVVSDKHYCHKNPAVSFTLSYTTHNAEAEL